MSPAPPPAAAGGRPLAAPGAGAPHPERYKWTVLVNTTMGVFMAMMNTSVVIISLPAIFRGIHVDPLQASNIGLLLWLLMSYMVVTAVLVVTFGRIGDLYGRVRMYNAGFAVFTLGSILLAVSPVSGPGGALVLIVLRVVQGIGGALLMANSMAIITDVFPVTERGMALGINIVAGISGSFLGLLVGGLLAGVNWRLVFLVSVPFGVAGTMWAYLKLHDTGARRQARVDWWGNATFAVGLVAVLVGLTYGLMPYGGHSMGWTSPSVLAELAGGLGVLGLFVYIESKVADPMFHVGLFRIRAFLGSGLANLLSNMGRGGLQFMLILWLQGIWLPLHGYSFASTPLWSGIYLVPMSIGYLLSGPLAGRLSDRHGQKWFSTVGMFGTAATFLILLSLPVDFPYLAFAAIVLANGVFTGLFSAPNTTTLMNAVPPEQRGAASGMRATFMNTGFVLSISIFFSLMIVGLASTLPHAMFFGLTAQGVPAAVAHRVAGLPPVGTLFAAFLGYNPIGILLGPHVLAGIGPAHAATVTGKAFFPSLISGPFHHGLLVAFTASAALCTLAGLASLWAGDEQHADQGAAEVQAPAVAPAPAAADDDAEPLPGPSRDEGAPRVGAVGQR
jgi:MFS family permease